MKKSLLFLLILPFFCQFVSAQDTYYVSAGGNNADDGSEGSPWATVSYAIGQASATDTIKIAAGTYTENLNIDKSVVLEGIDEGAVRYNASVVIGTGVDGVTLMNITLANSPTSLTVSGNDATIENSSVLGAIVVNSGVSGLTLSENDLSEATVQNSSANLIDASYNWWGSIEKADFSSKIDLVTVDYSPWINQEDDTNTSAGFQPSLASISLDGDSPGAETLQDAFDAIDAGNTLRLIERQSSAAYPSLAIDKNINLLVPVGDQPEIENISVDGNTISVDGELLVSQSVLLQNSGIIETINEGSQVAFGANVGDVNEDAGRLRGNFTIEPRNIGTGEISVLGVDIESGTDDLGDVTITRVNGESGIVRSNESESIAVTWFIESENAPSSGRTVKFSWRSENDNSESGIDQVQVWRFNEAADVWELVTPDAISATSSGTSVRTVTVNGVTEFSPWTVSDVTEPLPVTLTAFTADLKRPSVRLEWATASETNAHFFGIERSTDGVSFEEIARDRAAGESNEIRNYLYIDEGVANRLTGTMYYRLRMVDFDESFEYSSIVAVPLSTDSDLRIHADASRGTMELFTEYLPTGQYWLQVSDMLGNVLDESTLNITDDKPTFSLPLQSMNQGVYIVRCVGAQSMYTQKFQLN